MQSERIYLVWAHPRHDSLTANIADAIHQRAMERKIQVTELDLYRRNFNPVMTPEDEPDWKNMDKRYSPEVHQLYSELLEHDTLVVVFPLWWYSFPAMYSAAIFLIPICISFDTAEKRRYATYLILNRRFSFEF